MSRRGKWTARVGLLAGAAALAVPMVVAAQTTPWRATLAGANEVPAVTSAATGTFTATLDEAAGTLTWTLTVPSITNVTAAHIHSGAAGIVGPIVVNLFAAPAGSPASSINVSGTARAADVIGPLVGNFPGLVAALKAGTLYVNAHTTANPGGEIRAQISQGATPTPTATATATPSGANLTAIATALQGALDRGDVAAAMSLVTEDISVGGIGLCAASPCVGKDAVRPEFQRRVDANIQRVRLSVQVVGNTVTSIFEVRDNNTRRCNVERILLSEANDVRGSLVAVQRVQLDLTDAQTVALRACQQAAAAGGAAKVAPPKSGSGGYLDGGSNLGLWALGALAVVAAGVAFGAGVATRRRDQ